MHCFALALLLADDNRCRAGDDGPLLPFFGSFFNFLNSLLKLADFLLSAVQERLTVR